MPKMELGSEVGDMMTEDVYLTRLLDVQTIVAENAVRAGRDINDIRIVGVTKTVDVSKIASLLDAGLTDFGENRWQHARELLEHPRAAEAVWHFIGHLQSNKVKYIVPKFSFVHSIDSIDLAREIEQYSARTGRHIRGLIQVNVSGEESKYGLEPNQVTAVVKETMGYQALKIVGLMTMAPAQAAEDEIRTVFRGLRELRDEIRTATGNESFRELSMGMSGDFPLAVEEGATIIRVGRRLMG